MQVAQKKRNLAIQRGETIAVEVTSTSQFLPSAEKFAQLTTAAIIFDATNEKPAGAFPNCVGIHLGGL